ncbi:MAG: pyridoxamine 5'-phosphate oxidase [Gemmatimonadales bacterium]
MSLASRRRNYARAALDEAKLSRDPMLQFGEWFAEVERSELAEPNAMTLATADARGRPSARIVLFKGFDAEGFVFYTDYRSRKGRELESNPYAALVFHWMELERQVRVVGRVERVDEAQSLAYFRSRPIGSQLGAWASRQSAVLRDRSELDAQVARVKAEFAGRDIPLPPHWGGFRLRPDEVEFWQGRPDRLHDRILYTRGADEWTQVRLSP